MKMKKLMIGLILGTVCAVTGFCERGNIAYGAIQEKNDLLLALDLASIEQEHSDVQSFYEREYNTFFDAILNSSSDDGEKFNSIKAVKERIQEKISSLKYPDETAKVLERLYFSVANFAVIEEEHMDVRNFCEQECNTFNAISNSSPCSEEKLNLIDTVERENTEKERQLEVSR
jgi:hypothetical protein